MDLRESLRPAGDRASAPARPSSGGSIWRRARRAGPCEHAPVRPVIARPLALAFALCAAPQAVKASPCCAGSTVPGFERLALWEQVAAGLRLGYERGLGAWDAEGRWHPHEDYAESSRRADLWLIERLSERWQAGLRVGALHLDRAAGGAGGLHDAGGGAGDLGASVRFDLAPGGEGPWGLGVAFVAGLTVPTGRATEASVGPLAADATGEGQWVPSAGMALLRPFGDAFLGLNAALGVPLARTVAGRETRRGVELQTALLAGYAPVPALSLSVNLGHRWQGETSVDGRSQAGSGRGSLTAGLGGALDLPAPVENLAIQAALSGPVALDGAGRNLLAGLGGTLGLRVGWP